MNPTRPSPSGPLTAGRATRSVRGASSNPPNRFERIHLTPTDQEAFERGNASVPIELLRDPSRSIVATNESPDLGFAASVNPYRGCSHACAYCYARPTHEYLGYSAGLDFETKILVKERAPELLRAKLASRGWQPQVIAFSGVTDSYQPAERHLEITRRCLEVLRDFRNPVAVVTKSWLVTRDIDLLGELAERNSACVAISITTLDPTLQRRMEPRASRPAKRLAAIEALAEADIPVGVMVAPVVPGLTDHEIPAIVRAAADAGAGFAGKVVLRLPFGLKGLFDEWLSEHYPERRDKVMNRVRALRGGKLYDSRFGVRQRGTGFFAEQIEELFELSLRRAGLPRRGPSLSTAHFRVPESACGAGAIASPQLSLFD